MNRDHMSDDGQDSETPVDIQDMLLEHFDGIADTVTLTPAEHEKMKSIIHGDEFERIKHFKRRYLIVGSGSDDGAGDRRQTVYDLLDARDEPPAIATQLEDFGLTNDDIRLWNCVFDVLCGVSSHIVAVIEDFDGGYVWELGLTFSPSYRSKTWILKRAYESEEIEREKYKNGMAISEIELLLTGERAEEWSTEEELKECAENIP